MINSRIAPIFLQLFWFSVDRWAQFRRSIMTYKALWGLVRVIELERTVKVF